MKKLIDMLPEYYAKSDFVVKLQEAAQLCVDITEQYIENGRRQLNIMTCDKVFLKRYAAIYDVPYSESTAEECRADILAKKRSTGELTVDRIKAILKSYGCEEVRIVEDIPNFKVTIEFLTLLGEPPNFDTVMQSLRKILPAHLAIEYILLFNTWNDTADESYNDVKGYTWNELSVAEGVK